MHVRVLRCVLVTLGTVCDQRSSPSDVFLMGHWFEVCRVHAVLDPAQVINGQALGDRPNMIFVRPSMGRHAAPAVVEHPVPLRGGPASPQPAPTIALDDPRREPPNRFHASFPMPGGERIPERPPTLVVPAAPSSILHRTPAFGDATNHWTRLSDAISPTFTGRPGGGALRRGSRRPGMRSGRGTWGPSPARRCGWSAGCCPRGGTRRGASRPTPGL